MSPLFGAVGLGLAGTAIALSVLIWHPGSVAALVAIILHGAMWLALILWANLVWAARA